MRSTFAGLNTMVKGIYGNQLSLDTTGHNITNALTEGYSRQSVNLAATRGQTIPSLYGDVMVGTGVDTMSIERARNVYADKQYWTETAQKEYYATQQTNYDKVESIFDDSSNTGIKNALTEFYNAWNDLSTNASTSSNRVAVIEKSNVLADRIKTTAGQLQSQINSQYDDMAANVKKINDFTSELVKLNQNIMSSETSGANANDLRDQRDLIVDNLSKYMNLNVYEDEKGMYSVVSNGITMVNGVNRLTLEMSDAITNKKYGISDYNINIKESGVAFIPTNGSLKAQMDTIAEDKGYIDKLANLSGFLLTTFNSMHQQGAGIDGTDGSLGADDGTDSYKGPSYGRNFWGDDDTVYTWDANKEQVIATSMTDIKRSVEVHETTDAGGVVTSRTPIVTISGTPDSEEDLQGMNIIHALNVSSEITATGGQNLIAARKFVVEQTTDENGALQYETEANGTIKTDANGDPIPVMAIKVNGSGDGTNATNIATLVNMDQSNVVSTAELVYQTESGGTTTILMDTTDTDETKNNNMTRRAIDIDSMNAYYSASVAQLGSDSESVDDKANAQDDLIEQITNWRSSTAGVDWNEELSNMIMFLKGYSACSRCLTTMDEMLDRLINNTGMVGR